MVDYNSYEEFQDPQTYDLECDAFEGDFVLIERWAHQLGNPLLDLGCGTGRMAIHLAKQGYVMTGVDIVPQMVLHGQAKARQAGVSIDFVVADARAFYLKKQFRFIFMLMNAFQFLLTRQDHEAMLTCVQKHLYPDGCFVFETRNPNPRNLHKLRNPDGEHYILSDGGVLNVVQEHRYDPLTQIQHYKRHLHFEYHDGRKMEKTLRTALRYVYPKELDTLLYYNGFDIVERYGDWNGNPLTEESPSMIYVCRIKT